MVSVDNGIFIHAIVPRHIETVCCLYHRKDKFISVPYEPKDTEYLKMIPGSAAYDEIKKYVLKKYNVKVSSLYAAQVNEKSGFQIAGTERDGNVGIVRFLPERLLE